jgi:antitoxin component of RelBE/YafQ-DinJ toxin-antitoxin module
MTERDRISTQISPEIRAGLERVKVKLGLTESNAIREMLRAGISETDKTPRRKELNPRIVEDPFGNNDG